MIGVNDVEIERLGSQHATWQAQALKAWEEAGLKPGMSVADIGCGPGYASMDLARLVGAQGHVTALDQSRTFLRVLDQRAKAEGLTQIETVETPIEEMSLKDNHYDMIWCRWVLSFLADPQDALARMYASLKPGGVMVLQEYGHYRTFRINPHDPVLDRFLDGVERSWEQSGGDANIGRRLPAALHSLGCQSICVTPLVFAAEKGEPFWNWPWTWINQAPDRIMELGALSREDAQAFRDYLKRLDGLDYAWLTTPGVYQIIACKPD